MTAGVLLVGAVMVLIYGGARLWARLIEPPEAVDHEDDDAPEAVDTVECRHAVHEAGHAVAAWCCTHVTEIEIATIEAQHGGMVRFAVMNVDDPAVAWHRLVIHLAGVAAEAMVYARNGQRTTAEDDFKNALERAQKIGRHPLPWADPGGPTLAFRKIYLRPPPSDEHVRTLEAGYRMARHVVRSHGSDFYRLVSMLLTRKTVSHADIERVLGHRAHLRVLAVFGPKFVVPRRQRAPARAASPR